MATMGYEVELIDLDRCNELRSKYQDGCLYSSKSDISGICVELFSADREHMDMWMDNFYHMSDHVRSHARIFSVKDPNEGFGMLYEPVTATAFLLNFDYYGWIKSIALGIAGNILEESHKTFSIHGAALDIDGMGVTLIAPSKTGKTTQSWGLLRAVNAHLISDDWYFVNVGCGRPVVYASEKNCYIDADIGDVWEEYRPLIVNVKFDNKARGIANVRWITGESSVIPRTTMRYVILMKRDPEDPCIVRKMSTEESVSYMIQNDLCNPHQIVRNPHKSKIREEFITRYFSACSVYLINTIKTAKETQDIIREIISAQE